MMYGNGEDEFELYEQDEEFEQDTEGEKKGIKEEVQLREPVPRISGCSQNQKSIDNGGTPQQKKYGSTQMPIKKVQV